MEDNTFQQFSARPVPRAWKRGQNGALQLPNRVDRPGADSGSSNAFGVASAVNDHEEDGDMRRPAMCMEKNREESQELDLAMRITQRIASKEDTSNSLNQACNGNHDPVEELFEEEDAPAYDISEFFNAFRDGQEHNLLKIMEKAAMEGSLGGSGGIRHGVVPKPPSLDGQSSCESLGLHGGEGSSGCGLRTNSHSRSGSSYLEGNSLSPPSSGYLPFSGPIASFGHPAHVTYSGSVSHRSDSSTASAHSFAFPILPWEWNSSPVKLAQPDNRYTRQSWKRRLHNFFCCTK